MSTGSTDLQQANIPVPTIGRIMVYRLSQDDVDKITKRLVDARDHMDEHREKSNGVIVHVGNNPKTGQPFAMIVTAVWSDTMVNGQVFLDGNHTYWVMSRSRGTGPGQWDWPARV